MPPANVKVTYYGGAATEPAGVSVDSVGGAVLRFDRSDAVGGTGVLPLRTATGTNFSAVFQLALKVVTAGSGSGISNRRLYRSGAAQTGLALYALASSAYLDQTGGPAVPSSGASDGATPAGGYAAVTETAQIYDASSAAPSVGRNGGFVRLVTGVDNLYTGGPSAVAVPLVIEYDEV